MVLNLCRLPPKKYIPSLIIRNISDKPKLRGFLQNILPVLLKTTKDIKTRKFQETVTNQEPMVA